MCPFMAKDSRICSDRALKLVIGAETRKHCSSIGVIHSWRVLCEPDACSLLAEWLNILRLPSVSGPSYPDIQTTPPG
jgi:hypothetical protein